MAIQMEVAPPKDRFVAAAIDLVPPFLLFVALAAAGFSGPAMILALFSSVYFVFRDVVGNGQSVGKRICNLQVIDTETDRVPPAMGLILRNLGFGAPGLNVVYAIVEGIRVLQQPQGLRFGDMFAETGVVKVPAAEREKLLVPKKDRPSREMKAVEGGEPLAGDAAAAPAAADGSPAGGVVPGAAPKPQPSVSGSRPRPDRPSGGGGAALSPDGEARRAVARPVIPEKPASGSAPSAVPAAPAAASSAPKPKAPLPIDLPPEEPKAAAPAPSPAAPAPQGVALGSDDPLKKLIDSATAKK